jgi:hypothetical protein
MRARVCVAHVANAYIYVHLDLIIKEKLYNVIQLT